MTKDSAVVFCQTIVSFMNCESELIKTDMFPDPSLKMGKKKRLDLFVISVFFSSPDDYLFYLLLLTLSGNGTALSFTVWIKNKNNNNIILCMFVLYTDRHKKKQLI